MDPTRFFQQIGGTTPPPTTLLVLRDDTAALILAALELDLGGDTAEFLRAQRAADSSIQIRRIGGLSWNAYDRQFEGQGFTMRSSVCTVAREGYYLSLTMTSQDDGGFSKLEQILDSVSFSDVSKDG